MAIQVGQRLGPYEILSAIGAGGMGEVYRARDTRLERTVAVKILPDHLSDRAELRERFDREARTVASLNHPHICTLHDIGHQDGTDFLVMEYLEGETLAERLKKGPLPLDQVLQYAIEISDALDKAHRKGITHRDLKPGNIMLTKSGTKLLDFGLAKLRGPQAAGANLSALPTEGSNLTAQGTILGTLQYMAPEQLEGKEVDARTDIFAFGLVVYEMATGKKAFEGKSQASLIAKILETDPPPISMLQPMTPPALDRVVKRCLCKEPDHRWQTASDLCEELKWIADGGSQAGLSTVVPHRTQRRLGWIGAALAIVAFFGALASAVMYLHRPTSELQPIRFTIGAPEKSAFVNAPASPWPAVSPDGRQLAFETRDNARLSLWVRSLGSLSAQMLADLGIGLSGGPPFWSTDSRYVGFVADGKLKKVAVSGGPAETLCDAVGAVTSGGTWNQGGTIIFSQAGGLFRVPASGGEPRPLTKVDSARGEYAHVLPRFLPDGKHFLYVILGSNLETAGIYVGSLDSTRSIRVLNATSQVEYSAGHLLFVRGDTLEAQRFDTDRLDLAGDAFPVAQSVGNQPWNARAAFGASPNGVLTYRSGGEANLQLTWFDRSGKVLGTVGTPSRMVAPAISPDGAIVAVDQGDPQTGLSDIWLHDLGRGTASRFTSIAKTASVYPVWSPDGSHIAFSSDRDGPFNAYQKATNGNSQDEALDKSALTSVPVDWSRDGRYVIEAVAALKTGYDVWVLPQFGDRKPFPYLQTEFNELFARLSPDGHWLAYTSDETKRYEVYVQSFPTPGVKWQISSSGGSRPVWSRDGKELFFIGGSTTGVGPSSDQKLMVVEVKSQPTKDGAKFEASIPKPLFNTHLPAIFDVRFDVSKDGRFLMPVQTEQSADVPLTVVVNWTAGEKK